MRLRRDSGPDRPRRPGDRSSGCPRVAIAVFRSRRAGGASLIRTSRARAQRRERAGQPPGGERRNTQRGRQTPPIRKAEATYSGSLVELVTLTPPAANQILTSRSYRISLAASSYLEANYAPTSAARPVPFCGHFLLFLQKGPFPPMSQNYWARSRSRTCRSRAGVMPCTAENARLNDRIHGIPACAPTSSRVRFVIRSISLARSNRICASICLGL